MVFYGVCRNTEIAYNKVYGRSAARLWDRMETTFIIMPLSLQTKDQGLRIIYKT